MAGMEVQLGWSLRLLAWLTQGWSSAPAAAADPDGEPPPDITPLMMVRFEFIGCLDDVPTQLAADLAGRIRRARSLRELWHLRTDVFNVVSRHCDQGEAMARLKRLNRHFPVRAPRSGFVGLDAL